MELFFAAVFPRDTETYGSPLNGRFFIETCAILFLRNLISISV